ncbi:MAG TPA: hypothetical protein VD971_12885 [Phycisphaerales bacterium]|nr:hypothetical protein [Phycisphaerales bacterium]
MSVATVDDDKPAQAPKPDAEQQPKAEKPKPATTVQQVVIAAKQFASGAVCDGCSGTGRAPREGRRDNGGGSNMTLQKEVHYKVECTACKGVGLRGSGPVWNLGTKLVGALASISTTDPKWGDNIEKVRASIAEVAAVGLSALQRRIAGTVETKLTSIKPEMNEPLLCVGLIADDNIKEGDRRLWIELSSSWYAVIERPRITDGFEGKAALAGGIVRRIEDRNGRKLVELHDGFVMTTKVQE